MNQRKETVSFLSAVKSVLAAFFGVQSEMRRKQDFKHGNPMHFIFIGLALTVIFILVIFGMAKMAIHFLS